MITINHDAKPLDKIVDWFNPVPLDLNIAVDYFQQLLQIVDACHRSGIIHRDIKPNNILISENRVYLIDFGLSCVINENMGISQVDDRITSDFWSGFSNALVKLPEFDSDTDGDKVRDPRSDIALCVAVFYYMLTGERKFSTWNREKSPKFIDSLKYTYVIEKGIQFLIENRFQTIDEVFATLNLDVDGEEWTEKRINLSYEIQIDIKAWKSEFCSILYFYHPKDGYEPRLQSDGRFETKHKTEPKNLMWIISNNSGNVVIQSDEDNPLRIF